MFLAEDSVCRASAHINLFGTLFPGQSSDFLGTDVELAAIP